MAPTQAASYQGARGSNAGDQFHEFWALEQVLQLLEPGTTLKAVTVEGVKSEAVGPDDPAWDGVDCGQYFGGETLETADEVHLSQLKYSTADPDKSWTVARLTNSTASTTNNSVIRRLANAYKKAKGGVKAGAVIKVRLVSNQPISERVRKALCSRWSGSIASARFYQQVADDLKELKTASGLSESDFADFVSVIDLSEAGQASRFATEAKVVSLVAQSLGDDVSSEVSELLRHIRQMMLPEAHRDVINEHVLLTWFDLGSREGLFPAPADIVLPTKRIPRAVAPEVIDALNAGERLILVQGEGGCGKTTLMQEVADRLPKGSVSQLFDCFGGGRCVHSDDKRHLPENAFLQMTNDLATRMGLPTFIPRSNKHPASIRTFMAKLRLAGDALKLREPGALLVVQVDAADNSVTAAAENDEHPFVFDLVQADLGSLPDNVRVLVSARKARADSLKLSGDTKTFTCPPFNRDETKSNLEAAFGNVSDAYVDQFHDLTNHIPRVQAYAIAGAERNKDKAIDLLLPGGRTLNDVLRSTFKLALQKHGQEERFDKIVAALAYLPAPATPAAVARLADTSVEIVRDFVSDLPRGLRLSADGITIADEDFDAFIRDKSKDHVAETTQAIADQFLATYKDDAYSSLHLADALVRAGREEELLAIIQKDPQPAAIQDPIIRRQVQLSRLKLSLAACRKADSPVDALKTVLISAEAEGDESKLTQLMFSELDLSVDFGGASLRRTILLDRERIFQHGSFLAHEACSAARNGNSVQARQPTCVQRHG